MKLQELFEAVKTLPGFKLMKSVRSGGRVGTTPPMTYEQLVKIFGKPREVGKNEGDDKVTTEWNIKFNDGIEACIYDYKATNRYSSGLPSIQEFRKQSYDWSISGGGDLPRNLRERPLLYVLAIIMKHLSNDEVIKMILVAHKDAQDGGLPSNMIAPQANTLIGAARLAGKDLPEFAAIEKSIDASRHEE